MIKYAAVIEKFAQKGEKTGWSYVAIPQHIAQEIKADCKISYRIKGLIDEVQVTGLSLVPMGDGEFILPLNATLRRSLGKEKGAIITLQIEEDRNFKIEIPDDLNDCLSEQEHMIANFLKMPKSHQNYYINWINEAKTEHTRAKRLMLTVEAMDKNLSYSEMMRLNKAK